jgi:two-component system chemotaxis response regulator CheB
VGPLHVKPENTAVPEATDASVPAFDVVVIGASAGGLPALATLLAELPGTFPVPVALVLHLSPDRPSVLTDVLARYTRLRVRWAENGSKLTVGTIYVAPPDRHVILQSDGIVSLVQTPLVHFSRPSVDLLFESAARAFGRRTLAVILTGNGYDGSDGVRVVHQFGGVVIAQDEASSQYFSMPREAIESGGVSFVLPLAGIGSAVRRLVALGIGAGVEGAPPSAR